MFALLAPLSGVAAAPQKVPGAAPSPERAAGEAQPAAHYSIADASGNEGNALSFVITRNGPPSARLIVVSIRTRGGSASAGDDYRKPSILAIFAPGEASTRFVVQTVAGADTKPARTFTVTLAAAPGPIDRATATGTIRADRAPPPPPVVKPPTVHPTAIEPPATTAVPLATVAHAIDRPASPPEVKPRSPTRQAVFPALNPPVTSASAASSKPHPTATSDPTSVARLAPTWWQALPGWGWLAIALALVATVAAAARALIVPRPRIVAAIDGAQASVRGALTITPPELAIDATVADAVIRVPAMAVEEMADA